jgi:hypothetical protein
MLNLISELSVYVSKQWGNFDYFEIMYIFTRFPKQTDMMWISDKNIFVKELISHDCSTEQLSLYQLISRMTNKVGPLLDSRRIKCQTNPEEIYTIKNDRFLSSYQTAVTRT